MPTDAMDLVTELSSAKAEIHQLRELLATADLMSGKDTSDYIDLRAEACSLRDALERIEQFASRRLSAPNDEETEAGILVCIAVKAQTSLAACAECQKRRRIANGLLEAAVEGRLPNQKGGALSLEADGGDSAAK